MSESTLTADERAELAALRDLKQRVIGFGGDDFALMPWIDAHQHHADEPYIGCPFCRDQFVRASDVTGALDALAGEWCTASSALWAASNALHDQAKRTFSNTDARLASTLNRLADALFQKGSRPA